MTALLTTPDTVPFAASAFLIAASFFTSLLTAVFGAGGGLTLLAIIAQLLPASAIIPVHAVVQAGSNSGRAFLLVRHVKWQFFVAFCIGAAAGALVGGYVVITLPQRILQGALALFMIVMLWGPALPHWAKSSISISIQGFVSSVLTMFVGATGPFLLAAMKPHHFSPLEVMSTFAMSMTVQHALKIAVFAALGFAFKPYLGLIIWMMLTGFLGTLTGTKIVKKRKPEAFEAWLKLILTVLALRLAYIALAPGP